MYLPKADIQAEIIAVDLDDSVSYNIMIDVEKEYLEGYDFIDARIEDCNSDTVYYRKKALKKKSYDVWISSDTKCICGKCCSKG